MINEEQREKVGRNVAIWIVTNAITLVCIPVLHYIYLDRLLDYEYASGIRKSTDGDIFLIEVLGGFILLVILSFIVNLLGATYIYLRYFAITKQDPR